MGTTKGFELCGGEGGRCEWEVSMLRVFIEDLRSSYGLKPFGPQLGRGRICGREAGKCVPSGTGKSGTLNIVIPTVCPILSPSVPAIDCSVRGKRARYGGNCVECPV